MFEKEANKWVENNLHSTEEDYIKAFKDGAEFGYNKYDEQLTKAKELIKEMLSILPKENIEGIYEITEEAEQFIREEENDRNRKKSD